METILHLSNFALYRGFPRVRQASSLRRHPPPPILLPPRSPLLFRQVLLRTSNARAQDGLVVAFRRPIPDQYAFSSSRAVDIGKAEDHGKTSTRYACTSFLSASSSAASTRYAWTNFLSAKHRRVQQPINDSSSCSLILFFLLLPLGLWHLMFRIENLSNKTRGDPAS